MDALLVHTIGPHSPKVQLNAKFGAHSSRDRVIGMLLALVPWSFAGLVLQAQLG
jgi:hypothetical protein